MYKASNGLSPPLISDIVKPKNRHLYNLRHYSQFSRPLVKNVFRGTENISYLGKYIIFGYSVTYKQLPSLEVFKNRIKKWKPENCPCRLCKTCVSRVGFI